MSDGQPVKGWCECGKEEATARCWECWRLLCPLHQGLRPCADGQEVELIPVCHPVCDAAFWPRLADLTPKER